MAKTDFIAYTARQRSRESTYTVLFSSVLRGQYMDAAKQYRQSGSFELSDGSLKSAYNKLYNNVMVKEYDEAYSFYVKPYTDKTKTNGHDNKDILSDIAALLQTDFFLFVNEFLRNFASNYLLTRIASVNNTTKDRIGVIISNALRNGYSPAEVARAIEIEGRSESVLERSRSIAKTELGYAGNRARDLAIQSSEFIYDKFWNGILDDRIRNSHRLMDSLGYVPMDHLYEVPRRGGGVDHMEYPHDSNGSAENVVNCRCVLEFAIRVDSNGRPIRKS